VQWPNLAASSAPRSRNSDEHLHPEPHSGLALVELFDEIAGQWLDIGHNTLEKRERKARRVTTRHARLSFVISVANGLILRPLPVAEPRRLVTVTSAFALRFGFQGGAGWNYAMWDQLQQRATVFDGALAWTLQRVEGAESGETRPFNALVTSGGFFDMLGVRALAGRTFTSADEVRGGGPDGGAVVISEALWQQRFNRAANVVGSRLAIDGAPLLYGLKAHDPATLAVATALLAVVALVAGWRPASRAVRIDPARVLRET